MRQSRNWTRRLARYRRLAARMHSDGELSILRAAYLRHAHDVEAIQARYGDLDAAEATEEGRLLSDAAFEQREAAEDAYHDRCVAPTDRAAVLLALTPAPDFEALLVKIRLMQEHRLDELDSLERPALEVLAEDVERLAAAPYFENTLLGSHQNRHFCAEEYVPPRSHARR